MKLYPFRLLILLFSMHISGCEKEDNPINPQEKEISGIFPLSVGNYWERYITVYDTTGSFIGGIVDTIKVLRDTLIQNQKHYIVNRDNQEQIWINKSDGLWYSSEYITGLLMYKYPASKNDSIVIGGNLKPVRIFTVDSLVTVPAGTFRCYGFQNLWFYGAGDSLRSFQWFEFISPEVGFVSMEGFQSFNNSTRLIPYVKVKLSSCKIN